MNEQLLSSNHRNVRVMGVVYRIIAHNLGTRLLCEAENVVTRERVNLLKSRSPLCKTIRNLVSLNLFV